MERPIGSNFDGNLFGKSRERVTVEEQFYNPKLHEAKWFLEENPSKSSTTGYLVSQADHYYYQKNWLQAAHHYLKARELLTEKSTLLQRITSESLSRCYLHLENYDTAMEWAQKLLNMCQSLELRVIAHSLIANICHALGHSAEEAEHLKFCLSRQPLNGIHWFHLGLSYLHRRGEYPLPAENNRTKEKINRPTDPDSDGVSEEVESLLSRSKIAGDQKCGSMNGFESKVSDYAENSTLSEYAENSRKIGVSCEKMQNQNNEEMILKEENGIGETKRECKGNDMRKTLKVNGLIYEEVKLTSNEHLQNGVDINHWQTEKRNGLKDVDLFAGASSDEQRREERGVKNHDSDESTEMTTSEVGHDASSHKGKRRVGSCHDVCTSYEIEDYLFALICFIRARILLKPSSSLCNIKSNRAFLEVESCIRSLDFTEVYIAEIYQLCWKRQFSLEIKPSKAEDKEKKGRNSTVLISDRLESIFEDIWLRSIILQTNIDSKLKNVIKGCNIPEVNS